MTVTVIGYDPTPNPNALIFRLSGRLSEVPRSFLNAEMAQGDPLADALFVGAPITAILINGDWMTINKQPSATWPRVKECVERVLAEVAP